MSTQTGGNAGDWINAQLQNAQASGVSPGDFSGQFTMGSPDANSGLDSLNAGLMGPNAGTLPNGFNGTSAGNYTPGSALSGISDGSLNGNLSFTMPTDSSSTLNTNKLQTALGGLSNIPQSGEKQQSTPTGSGRVSTKQVNFSSPIADFAGANGGSQGLIQLLSKYRPGVM